MAGDNVTLATPTASGKTLALTLPTRLRRRLRPEATILCIAPTRVLVEQWRKLLQVWDPAVRVASSTGDTAKGERAASWDTVQCLVTTDMLHMGLLPYHTTWHCFLSRVEGGNKVVMQALLKGARLLWPRRLSIYCCPCAPPNAISAGGRGSGSPGRESGAWRGQSLAQDTS